MPSWTRWLAVGWTLLTLAWLLFPDVPFNPSDPYDSLRRGILGSSALLAAFATIGANALVGSVWQ